MRARESSRDDGGANSSSRAYKTINQQFERDVNGSLLLLAVVSQEMLSCVLLKWLRIEERECRE